MPYRLYSTKIKKNKLHVKTLLWSEPFNYFIRSRGGEWNTTCKSWIISAEYISFVDEKLYYIFGTNTAHKIELTIKRYKINEVFQLFSRDLIEIDQFKNRYMFHSTVKITKGEISNKWSLVDSRSHARGEFKCYLLRKIATFVDPFVISNLILSVDDVSASHIDDLIEKSPSWIENIKIIY